MKLSDMGMGPSLTELLAYYKAGDDIQKGIKAAEQRSYEIMRAYPTGVPTGVMYAALNRQVSWMADLLASMMVEIAGEVRKWNEEDVKEQENMTHAVFQLLSTHAMNVTLQGFAPTGDEDE